MAAALPPVNVIIPAGPPTPDSRTFVDANDDVVAKLPFLNWQPEAAAGGLPRMSLTRLHARPWSPATDELFPAAARERARRILRVVYLVAFKYLRPGLAGVDFVGLILPFDVLRV